MIRHDNLNEEKTYLLKVRYALSRLRIYMITTRSIYYSVGALICNSIEKVEDVRYSEWSPERANYWEDQNFEIQEYKNIELRNL